MIRRKRGSRKQNYILWFRPRLDADRPAGAVELQNYKKHCIIAIVKIHEYDER